MKNIKVNIIALSALSLMVGWNLGASPKANAQDASTDSIKAYFKAFRIPSQEEINNCKNSDGCKTLVSIVEKNNLHLSFLLDPLSDSLLPFLPPEIAAGLHDNRAALRTFGTGGQGVAGSNTFTIGENGQPHFGGANPQAIIWGNLIGQNSEGNSGTVSASGSLSTRNPFVRADGEQAGQSGTGTNPPNDNAGAAQTPTDAQAKEAEDRLLRGLDQQASEESGVIRPPNYSQSFWDKLTPEEQKGIYDWEISLAQDRTGGVPSRQGTDGNDYSIGYYNNDFYQRIKHRSNNFDQDPNSTPITVGPIPAWMVRKVENINSVKSFELKRPGVSDPSYHPNEYESEARVKRTPTAAQQAKAAQLIGPGGYTQTQKAQWYGAGRRPDDAPIISGDNCPAGADGSCGPRSPVR